MTNPLDTLRTQVISRMGAVERTRERAMDRNDMAVAETAKARIDTYRVVLDMIGRLSADPEHEFAAALPALAKTIESFKALEDYFVPSPIVSMSFEPSEEPQPGVTHTRFASDDVSPPDLAPGMTERTRQWASADAQFQTLTTIARDLSIGDQRTLIDLARRLQRKD